MAHNDYPIDNLPLAYDLPELSGKYPWLHYAILIGAANVCFLSAYTVAQPHDPVWKARLVTGLAVLFPVVLVLLLRRHGSNRALRWVWNEVEVEVFEAIYKTISELSPAPGEQPLPLRFSEVKLHFRLQWLNANPGNDYGVSVRTILEKDVDRLEIDHLIFEEMQRENSDLSLTDTTAAVYLRAHRRYIYRIRPDLSISFLVFGWVNLFSLAWLW